MEESININARGNILDVLRQMREGFEDNSRSSQAFQQNAATSLSRIQNSLRSVNLAAFHQNLQNVNQGLQDLNAPGLDFNASLSELSALTGTTGKDLDQLGDKARASAKEFGGTAAASVNTYKTILGRLGPDIAKNKDALGLMERNVQVLSKTMGGDAAGAVDALTTGMLQFGVDLSNPKTAAAEMSKMMDVMANSAQAGAAEVPQISAALKVSGVAAKQAKVSFIETNAAIQALATGGKEGSEAGMALRNVLGKMAGEDVIPKEAAEKLRALGVNMNVVSDTSLPFTTRLRELKKAQGDATIMAQVFGTENAAAANILLSSADAQDKLASEIGKTGGAQEQANVVMESAAEKMARMKAHIDDTKLAFFEATGGVTAYLGPVTEVMTTMNSFAPIFSMGRSGLMKLRDVFASTNTTMRQTTTTAGQTASSITNVGRSSGGAGSMVSGLGSMLKGVGWAAVAAGVAAVAARIYDVASGAMEARKKLEEFKKGSEEGTKRGETYKNEHLSRMNAEIEAARNLKIAGDITEEEYLKREKASRRTAGVMLKNDIYTNNLLRENRAKALKDQRKDQEEAENGFWSLEGTKKVLGINAESDKTAVKRGALAEVDASNKVLLNALKENESELGRLNAEEKGLKKNPLVSPAGYSPKTTSQASEKTMSGAGEVKRIDVRIENLIKGDVVIQSTTITEGMAQIKKMVSEAMVGAVRDFEVAM